MSIRRRVLIGGAATLAVGGASLGWFLAAAPQHEALEVQVEDTAEVLYPPDLLAGLDGTRFHEPTTVAVFTHRGGQAALTDDRALNDAVLEHARQERTDWLSADEQRWADGLFVLAVDPEGRLVGTYFGDDREVGEGAQLAIQDAAKPDFQAGRWTEGSVAGVQAAADRIGAPVIRQTGGAVVAALASLLTLAGAGTWVGVGLHRVNRCRRHREVGDAAMAAVVRDHDLTRLHATVLPESSRYGGLMLQRHDDYTRGFREMVELGDEVRAFAERDLDSRRAVQRHAAYEQRATSLDHLDDVIADTAAFLNRDSGWAAAWDRQVAPVRADLEGVDGLVERDLRAKLRGLPEVQQLRALASAGLVDLDRLRGDLDRQAISPDDALDRLRATRDSLSAQLDALAAATAREFGTSESERTTMRDAMHEQRRARPHEPTILATADPTWLWFGTGMFRSGLSTGTSQVEQSRSSSSTGATSGYSGGGSFSGAGSSSRF
ncbi:DUF5129 domain-containing protein [Jannaschia sp. R86511]|uniref:DUF5129 domain-containing protein n=1 Tax=Jannaschia sp. R86511 TaxID=3093853 RepID=UPI0036D2E272